MNTTEWHKDQVIGDKAMIDLAKKEQNDYLWADDYNYCVERQAAKVLHLPEILLRNIDGRFTPTETTQPTFYRYSTIGRAQIVAWHDYTVDQRPGSNSMLIGIGFESAEEMLIYADVKFPSVMKRQPQRPTPWKP